MWVSTLLQRRKIGPLGAGDSDRQKAVALKNSGGYCFGSVHSKGVDSYRFSAGFRISGGNVSGGGHLSSCDGVSGANDDLLSNGGSFPDGDCLSGDGDRKGGGKKKLECDARIRIAQRGREVDCDREVRTNYSSARWRHSTLRNVS
jgi:hypothetical protein